MELLYIFLTIIALIVLYHFLFNIYIYILTKNGHYPKNGEESIEDVRRLLHINKVNLAIRCYRKVFNVSLKDAQLAVSKMQHER